ncbi:MULTISPECIES: hypothetical protein [Methylobacterium]|uniref:hypothetical protein n=1 Tax=Methylobacterium TaxID=407 RepID=UPI0010500839|nr:MULTISPECIES: hypothetical protein [Methylobacterium]MDR7035345.1 hypothetical protein [Methylobacterium sp. BE186]
MSHFEKSLLDADPEAAARLREVLHGAEGHPAAAPTLAARFGTAAPDPAPRPARGGRPRRDGGRCAKALVTP